MTIALRVSFRLVTTAIGLLSLTGCTTVGTPDWATIAARNPAPVVTATRETDAVQTANADAADDPAIWHDKAKPEASLIVATDKKAGLNVYDLTGRQRHFIDAGRVNNVDLIDTMLGGKPIVLVAASDRNDPMQARIALFRLDTAAAQLQPIGTVPAGAGEAYGICLANGSDGVDAFVVLKDGTINQVALNLQNDAPSGAIVRTMKLATQSEGCVVDPASQRLYVAEEDVGIWRFDARAAGDRNPVLMAKVDGRRLVADVEGVALGIAPDGRRLLVASSQGDNAYAVFDLSEERYIARFRIAAGAIGATSETDGIALKLGDFGEQFPAGLFVAQDGDNRPNAQNFKLVDWRQIAPLLAGGKTLAAPR